MKADASEHRDFTPQEIGQWISRYRASGMGLGAFAARHHLSKSRLHYWVYDKRYSKLAQSPAAVPLFQELKLAGGLAVSNWVAEVSLSSGLAVRFSAAAAPEWIGSVVTALQRPC
jgi:glycerol kinase